MAESTQALASPAPAPSSSARTGCLIPTILLASLLANVLFVYLWIFSEPSDGLADRYHSGERSAKDKIAIVRVEGLIVEIFSGYVARQLQAAAEDENVKAVVLAINSPGGTITASDQLHKQIKDLQQGKWESQTRPKPIVASMESIAASGGYYLAAPADRIVAQPTTITGSIGIFAAIPDLSQVPERYGIDLKLLKRGELKGGSMFRKMTPAEARNIEDMLDAGYERFMQIVQEGRGPRLKHALREPLPAPEGKPIMLENGETYTRRLADGGIFTAAEALRYGLVDEIGYLDTAIQRARKLAGLDRVRVVAYVRPLPYWRSLLGIQTEEPQPDVGANHIPGLTAQLWYLTPGFELNGLSIPTRSLR